MNRQTVKQYLLHAAVIGLFSVAVMSYSFYQGLTSGNDLLQHYQFAHTIHQSVVSGEFYPSRADTPNQGYGDYGIRFYPPFSYYVLSAAYFLAGDWYAASLFTFFLIFWVGGIGVYLWSKEEFPSNQSLLAAGLYVFAPYHVNQIYNNFLYAEFAASAVVPFCFLFITRACRRGKAADVLGLSVSYALLILTHLPSTIICSLVLFVYAISLLKKETFLQTLPKLAIAVAVAGAAGSFYWLRMITEFEWVKHSTETYFARIFDYRENFLFAPQNVLNFHTDASVLWFADLMLLAMLLATIPAAVILLKNYRNQSGISKSVALIFVVSVLMTTLLTKPIWDNLFFLQKVQFPWRWLGVVAASGAVFSAGGIIRAAELMNQRRNYFLSFGLGVILFFYVFMSAFVIKQAVYLPREQFARHMSEVPTANSFDCWWTIWAKTDAFAVKDKLSIPNRRAEVISWDATEKEFNVSAGEAGKLRVATFYYPHWRAEVDGKEVRIEQADDSSMLIPLDGEAARVTLHFQEPYFIQLANVASLIAWLLFVNTGGLLLFKKIYNLKNSAESLRTL